jgi:tetratricopeptide (TPR) repeat protein
VGKSTLIARFLDDAAADPDTVILQGRCYEHESVPYKALDSVVDALSRYLCRLPSLEVQALLPRDVRPLTRLFPVLRRVEAIAAMPGQNADTPDQQEVRRRAFAGLRELLARLGDRRRVVLAIDDLQWGDADSASLLGELLRPPDAPVLLATGGYRSEDVGINPFLRGLFHWRDNAGAGLDWREVAVAPLALDQARELARSLLSQGGVADERQIEVIANESLGSPFFVHELVQAARIGAQAPDGAAVAGTPILDNVLLSRVRSLSDETRRFLELIAVAGRPIRQRDAVLAAQLGSREHATVAELRSRRLIRSTTRSDQGELETYHDRIREAVVMGLEPALARDRHYRLATVLESSPDADPDFLAEHFEKAGCEIEAVRYYILAAGQADDALAFERAVTLYRKALGSITVGEEQRRQVRERLGNALVNVGRGAEAAKEYLLASEGADSDAAFELQRRAAMQLLVSGKIDAGLDVLGRVMKIAGVRFPSTVVGTLVSMLSARLCLRIRGLGYRERDEKAIPVESLRRIDACWTGATGLGMVDYLRGGDFTARALLLALNAGERSRIARTLPWMAAHVSSAGGPSARRTSALIRISKGLAERVNDPYASASVAMLKGFAAYFVGKWKEALGCFDQSEETLLTSCTGNAWELDTARTVALWSLYFLGMFAEIRRRHSALVRDAQRRGDLFALMNFGTFVMVSDRLGADEPQAAQDELNINSLIWSQKGFHIQHHNVNISKNIIYLYCSNSIAWKHAVGNWSAYRRSSMFHAQQVRVAVGQIRAQSALSAAVTEANPEPYLRDAEWVIRRLERERMPWPRAEAILLRAGVARIRRRTEDAIALFSKAAESFDTLDMRVVAAVARRRLGELLGGDEGRALILAADAVMTSQGVRNPRCMARLYSPECD